MPKILKKCTKCGKYSISLNCQFCKSKTHNPHPAPFSIDDKHGEYRRKAKNIINHTNKE